MACVLLHHYKTPFIGKHYRIYGFTKYLWKSTTIVAQCIKSRHNRGRVPRAFEIKKFDENNKRKKCKISDRIAPTICFQLLLLNGEFFIDTCDMTAVITVISVLCMKTINKHRSCTVTTTNETKNIYIYIMPTTIQSYWHFTEAVERVWLSG